MVFMWRKIFTSVAYFFDLLSADGRGHAHTINRNCKNRREANGAGMALMGTLNTSLKLQERCFQNSSLCLQFFFSLPGNSVKILALEKKNPRRFWNSKKHTDRKILSPTKLKHENTKEIIYLFYLILFPFFFLSYSSMDMKNKGKWKKW